MWKRIRAAEWWIELSPEGNSIIILLHHNDFISIWQMEIKKSQFNWFTDIENRMAYIQTLKITFHNDNNCSKYSICSWCYSYSWIIGTYYWNYLSRSFVRFSRHSFTPFNGERHINAFNVLKHCSRAMAMITIVKMTVACISIHTYLNNVCMLQRD